MQYEICYTLIINSYEMIQKSEVFELIFVVYHLTVTTNTVQQRNKLGNTLD